MRLGDTRGFVEAINEACTCGGGGQGNCCPACEVYHSISDMDFPSSDEVRKACEKAFEEGRRSMQFDFGSADRSPNPYSRKVNP